MNLMSEKYEEVVGAIFTMQGEVLKASKDSINPHFKSSYSSIESVMDALRDPMQKSGLCVVQSIRMIDIEMVLRTMLMHKSGQWIGSDYPIRPKDPTNPQAVGGAISYARRYSLAALTGLVQADDDGHEASKPKAQDKPKTTVDRQITEAEYNVISGIIRSSGVSFDDIKSWIKEQGFESLKDINISLFDRIVKHLEKTNAAA